LSSVELEPVTWRLIPPMEKFHQELHLAEMHVREIGAHSTLCGLYVPDLHLLLPPDNTNARRDCERCFELARSRGWQPA
jgi:hypothetical protein